MKLLRKLNPGIYSALLVAVLLCCGKKEEAKSTLCLPTALSYYYLGQPYGDSVVYRYDSKDRLIQMAYYSSGPDAYFLWISTEVSYNAADQPDTVWRKELLNNGDERKLQRETYVLTYTGSGQLSTAQRFSTDVMHPAGQFTFTHDNAGRLIHKDENGDGGTPHYGYTYTYNAQGNLTSSSFEDFNGTIMNIRSNSTFDSHSQFFEGSPALKIINVYLNNSDPGVNNPTASLVYKIGSTFYTNASPVNLTYTYNDRGWPLKVTTDDARIFERRYYYSCP